MKAIILFSGYTPILILTSFESITNPRLIEKQRQKTVFKKWVAIEVPEEQVKQITENISSLS